MKRCRRAAKEMTSVQQRCDEVRSSDISSPIMYVWPISNSLFISMDIFIILLIVGRGGFFSFFRELERTEDCLFAAWVCRRCPHGGFAHVVLRRDARGGVVALECCSDCLWQASALTDAPLRLEVRLAIPVCALHTAEHYCLASAEPVLTPCLRQCIDYIVHHGEESLQQIQSSVALIRSHLR